MERQVTERALKSTKELTESTEDLLEELKTLERSLRDYMDSNSEEDLESAMEARDEVDYYLDKMRSTAEELPDDLQKLVSTKQAMINFWNAAFDDTRGY